MTGWSIRWAAAAICFAAAMSTVGASQDRSAAAPSTGVVVEDVPTGSAGAKAGIKANDQVLTYDAKAAPSPWSLLAAEENTVDKTDVVLTLQRDGGPIALTVPRGDLGIGTRPSMPDDVLTLFEAGRSAEAAKKPDDAISKWTAAADAAAPTNSIAAAWLRGRA